MSGESLSLPALLMSRADAAPHRVASRTSKAGYWHEVGWDRTRNDVARIARGFSGLGLATDSTIGVLTATRWEWPLAVWGAHAVGAAALLIASDQAVDVVETAARTHHCDVWVVEDEEQFDKVAAVVDDTVPVVVIDPRGVDLAAHPAARSWDDFLGVTTDADAVASLRTSVASIDPDAIALMGIDAPTWTHRQLAGSFAAAENAGPALAADDEYLSFLPISWAIEQRAVLVDGPASGAVTNFGDRTGGVLSDLQAVQPTVVQAPAAFWEALAIDVNRRMEGAGRIAKGRFTSAISMGRRPGNRGRYWLTMFRPLLSALGLRRARRTISNGSVDETTDRFFAALGLTLEDIAVTRADDSPQRQEQPTQ